ncbi:hypothetical protein [Marivita hallyeonensis]|uniref:Sulfotransferase family protein n=1 Tax=Marivita hallyeonensis TaxID=996342 RepID=A0A1M5NXE2_9RHOB|nr:hypothetical protein [Marivita hallyeonensis]SHG94135.1 hypothetical protein SAMN05443551_1080 [Marivita hallyeonensis]
MQVVLHTGVHETDGDRLLKTLLRNRDGLRPKGVSVPGPGKYRKLISEMLNALNGAAPAPGARDVLVDSILDEDADHVDRLILSHENLFSVPKIAFQGGVIYRKAEQRLQAVRDVFEGDELELYMAVRNPATLLPALLAATPHDTMDALLFGLDPLQFRWTDLLSRIIEALPGVPITVWCDEDSPLIWGELIRDLAGVEPTFPTIGAYSRLAEIMDKEGMTRFRTYLEERSDLTEIQIRRAMVAFLDKYVDESKVEHELDIPGWDDAFVQEMSERYEEDVFTLGRLPGVTMMTP